MKEKLKSVSELSVKFVRNLTKSIAQKIKNNKKTTVFLVSIAAVFLFYSFNKFDQHSKNTQKIYESRVAQTQKIDDQLLKLKLNQKAKKFGIPNLHESDSSIVNYSQVSFDRDTFYVLVDNSQKVTLPKGRSVVILYKKDGSQVFYYNNYFFQKIKE